MRAKAQLVKIIMAMAIVGLIFTGQAFAHVGLSVPNGGENFSGGQTATITWFVIIEHGTQNWDLYYSVSGDAGPWIEIALDLPVGDPGTGTFHDYIWTVPAVSTTQARVKVVQDNVTVDYTDISDANFTINTEVPVDSGACCFPTGDCVELSLVECSQQGGAYQGDLTDCASVDCAPAGCCEGVRGDVNFTGGIDVSDLTYLVEYLFSGGPPPPCDTEADINGSGSIDVSDLTYLVDYLFAGGPGPAACP